MVDMIPKSNLHKRPSLNEEPEKKAKKKRNPLDHFLEELDKYDEGCEEPSPVISSGF